MKRILLPLAMIAVFLAASVIAQQTKPPDSKQPLPKTVDEAVTTLKTDWLSSKDRDWMLRNPQKQAVAIMYRPFGTAVRNNFGLWGDNQALRTSCGDDNPEGCSLVILNRLWESVRSDADPALVQQLDCQFQLAHTIRINYKGFYKLTTGELIKKMQSQIDEQMRTGAPVCQSSLTLKAVGKPDMSCFVAAPFARDRADQSKETTLESVLAQLGLMNLFTTSHEPPALALNFAHKCQFSRPPYCASSGCTQ